MPRVLLPDELTEDQLREIGIEDAETGLRFFQKMAGQGVTDDDIATLIPLLLDALRSSPDPDRALNSFSRWFASVGSPYSHLQMLTRHAVALDLFCLITGSSQYFADLLARQPEYFEIIANPGVRGGMKTAAVLYRDLSSLVDACQRVELKRDALRRWKAREMLRIGVRDLLGLADMSVTAREFSNMADACVQKAYDIALATHPLSPESPSLPFAVIGMGKLGGQELNYSSDIDLMFVHGDNITSDVVLEGGRKIEAITYLGRLAESLVKILAEDSANGHVFRVDMRLRPEGRFGALTRSLAGFRSYYESWAENWERQALIKARFLAGDRTLGEEYMAMITPFVYRPNVSADFIEDIRANKRRIEQKCGLEGQTLTNVKTGYGGIRDVEFLVQRFQLEFGGRLPRLRTQNTLNALQQLHHARLLTGDEAAELADDYQFLRTLEHRLQLLQGFQTQTLPPPADTRERVKVARRMGFAGLSDFESELEFRRNRLHAHLLRLFYNESPLETASENSGENQHPWDDLNELLDNIDVPAARERLTTKLEQAGFHDIPNALRALQLPMRGNEFGGMPPDTPLEFKSVATRLLELATHSPDPDAGLAGIEALALAVPNRAQLYASFDDSPAVMERLVLLGAASPPLLKRLARRLEWMESLFSEEPEEFEATFDNSSGMDFVGELAARLQGAKGEEAKLESIARFYQRETLRIGAREIWGDADAQETSAGLSRLAEAVLETLLTLCAEPLIASHAEPGFARNALARVAIVGLGKLGGAELGYSSDWDVVFAYDEEHQRGEQARGSERFALVNTLVERVIAAGKALEPRGANIEIDLRLRPWGRKGALIQTLHGFIEYYRTSAETWERQAALKARFVAGNPVVGRRFERVLQGVSFGRGANTEEDAAVQAMKRRIEAERLKVGERQTDLKLGHGGLSDIEWLAQRLQFKYGPERLSIRVPGTLQALSALASARLLDNAEADVLSATYVLLTRLRNALNLRSGVGHDALPSEPAVRRALARMLGYIDTAQASAEVRLWEDVHAQMTEVRRIFQRRFYEAT